MKMEILMTTQVSPFLNVPSLKLDLSSIQRGMSNENAERISTSKRQEQETGSALDTPLRRRDSMGPSLTAITETQDALSNFLRDILQHCRGNLGDEAFFRNPTIPEHHEKKEVEVLYPLLQEIRTKGMETDTLNRLKELTQKVAQELGLTLPHDSPSLLGADQAPCSSDRTSNGTPPTMPQSSDREVDSLD